MKPAIDKVKAAALLDALEAQGYYRYIHPSNIAHVKQEALTSGYLFGWEETKRVYNADSEDLTEGFTWSFLEEITPFLQTLGVPRVEVSHVFDNDVDHTVTVNGTTYTICTVEEEQQLSVDQLWPIGTERALTIVNDLLEAAGSAERVYQLFDGNDTHAIFLTPQLYDLIIQSAVLPPDWLPHPVAPNRK
jgi:hypothetical protein